MNRSFRLVFISLSLILLLIIIIYFPLGGDYNSIIERGENEILAFKTNENQDYILFVIAYISSFLGIDTPQGYSLLILTVILILSKRFGLIFLVLNIIFFSYLGITGYHRNYLSLLFLVWAFSTINPILLFVSIFTHKAAIFFLMILLFSRYFYYKINQEKKLYFYIINLSPLIVLMLIFTFIFSIYYDYLGPFKHYFEHYIQYEADVSNGAIVRYLACLFSVIMFYMSFKNKIYYCKNYLRAKNTFVLSLILTLVLSAVLLAFGYTIAPDRITLFSLILLSILISYYYNPIYKYSLFLVALPFLIYTSLWLIFSDKAYYLWGGQFF